MHLILCGDSIFDNGAYVRPGEPDVVAQVRARCPDGVRASLRAVDGSVTEEVLDQLAGLPEDATHLFLSSGGNDALMALDLLARPVEVAGDAFALLAQTGERFRGRYRRLLRVALETGRRVAACTIYYPRFDVYGFDDLGQEAPDAELQQRALGALASFNDAITAEAFGAGVPVIDLRLVCSEDDDFANPIEPSAVGGAKLADAVVGMVLEPEGWERDGKRVVVRVC